MASDKNKSLNISRETLIIGATGAIVGIGATLLLRYFNNNKALPAPPTENQPRTRPVSKEENGKKLQAPVSDLMPSNDLEPFSDRKFVRQLTKVQQYEAKKHRLELEAKYAHENSLVAELEYLQSPGCAIRRIPHVAAQLDMKEFPRILSPLIGDSRYRSVYGGEGFLPDDAFISPGAYVIGNASFNVNNPIEKAPQYLRAGPRKHLFYDPSEVRAAIVTCGGLCPGLNVVIREIFMTLKFNYKVPKVYGIKMGYKGFYTYDWEELSIEKVKKVHTLGGTILGSSRGGFDADKIIENLMLHQVNQVYVVGGDGTHRGILNLFKEITKRQLKISIIGIPKTIDNDIAVIDKSFGFETAVEEAQRAIEAAYVESHCAEFGLGLVKIMGRNSGFIAMYASLASRDVNICLVPEFKFELYGPRGLLDYIYRRLKVKGHCVIVVAEGAPSAMVDAKLPNIGKDASGNVKYGDIGNFLKDEILKYCSQQGVDCTLKLIDPTYQIRAVQANSYDKQHCSQLAQNAVHGAMAGWTGFTIGLVNNRTCMIPVEEVCSAPVKIDPNDRGWQRLLTSTGQPSFLNFEAEEQFIATSQKELK